MRLSAIKLAGFKSFVEPTTIDLRDDLTGIVGPNGCGKSNVIDAVRWVAGESSARQLRGEALEDVIFAGSQTRQPVGRAAVELVFDNTDGALGGAYAGYAEISIQREHTRRTGSTYRINGTRARRRDVQDLFLGTGLGGRASYALIGQGAVNRLIDARPDQIRDLLEEAAGISRYKARRRETETRIQHTRDNLERLADRIGEAESRIEALAAQSEAAAEYQRLQAENRRLRRGHLVLRWRYWRDQTDSAQAEQRRQKTLEAKHRDNKQRADRALGDAESDRRNASEAVDGAQTAYYDAQAEAQRITQAIENARQWRARRAEEQSRLTSRADKLEERLNDAVAERDRKADDAERIAAEQPAATDAEQRAAAELEHAEASVQSAEHERDALLDAGDNPQTELEALRARQAETERIRNNANERVATYQAELDALETVDRDALAADDAALVEHSAVLESEQNSRGECAAALESAAAQVAECERELESARDSAAALRAERAAEVRMKNALTGNDDEAINAWLGSSDDADEGRPVADEIEVDPEWQTAVERVLGDLLRARLVTELDVLGERETPTSALTLVADAPPSETSGEILDGSLAARLRGPAAVVAMAKDLFTVEDVANALARRHELSAQQRFITPDGSVISRYTLALPGSESETGGALARQDAIAQLDVRLSEADTRVADAESALGRWQRERDEKRQRLAELDQSIDERAQRLKSERAELDERRRHADRSEARRRELESELTSARQTIDDASARVEQTARRNTELEAAVERFQAERERCQSALGSAREARDKARETLSEAQRHCRDIETRLGRAQSERDAAESRVAEVRRASEDVAAQLAEFDAHAGEAASEPDETSKQRADDERAAAEQRLRDARLALEQAETACVEARERVNSLDKELATARDAEHAARTAVESAAARRNGVAEQLAEAEPDVDPAALATEMADNEDPEAWQSAQNETARRIEELGNVNLAAIDEHAEAVEQHRYLQEQHADLDQALATLNAAIEKIDRETRTRLKSTFDQVNEHFAAFFTELFGGGDAALERTENDWLTAGIRVVARPPGKPRVALAMLSGGEKTLTALALLFALFELNPAPFCMLDEVDAPLDDPNVERFCRLIERMAARVQFVMITHNKTTMERPRQLHGVTMAEAGVSRLVSVDIDAALAMAQ